MRNKKVSPYISIVFCSRNDQYTNDQSKRIQTFINFYAYYDKKYPGLFEFIICDWNPPEKTKPLHEEYDWSLLSQVKHLTVSSKIHAAYCPDNSRPILDYVGRNACIRRASAPFILVINQDIFLSASLMQFLAKHQLSKKHFYRADRCDFTFDYDQGFLDWKNLDKLAIKNMIQKHIRSAKGSKPMTLPVNEKTFSSIHTNSRIFEPKINGIIYSTLCQFLRLPYKMAFPIVKCSSKTILSCHSFHLHTNASGDFLIAPKQAFFDVHGFVETHEFYMHLDSYMCFQLFSAGYHQAILAFPHSAFHSHHDRNSREGRPESMTFDEHAEVFFNMAIRKTSYQVNSESWGLEKFTL